MENTPHLYSGLVELLGQHGHQSFTASMIFTMSRYTFSSRRSRKPACCTFPIVSRLRSGPTRRESGFFGTIAAALIVTTDLSWYRLRPCIPVPHLAEVVSSEDCEATTGSWTFSTVRLSFSR